MQDPPPSRADTNLRALDYEQVVGMVNLLTDVRFKLAAFVPALTAAAVALISSSDLPPPTQAVFGIGGFVFVLGIVVYDLRNSQIYNGAIGRATALEQTMFDRYGGDVGAGLFGSRGDTARIHRARGTDHFLRLPVNHGTALTLVYTAALAAWAWVILAAIGDELLGDDGRVELAGRSFDEGDVAWWAAGATLAVSVGFAWARHRHERRSEPRPVVVGVRLSERERRHVLELSRRRDRPVETVLHDAITAQVSEDSAGSRGSERPGPEPSVAFALRLNDREEAHLTRRKFRRRLLSEDSENAVRAAVRHFVPPGSRRPYGSDHDADGDDTDGRGNPMP